MEQTSTAVCQSCRELGTLLAKAGSCVRGPWYKRFLRGIRDEETLQTISSDLARIVQRYQASVRTCTSLKMRSHCCITTLKLSGVLSVEALTEQCLNRVEETYVEIKVDILSMCESV